MSLRYVGKTFNDDKTITEEKVVNVYECEDCHRRQKYFSDFCKYCEKLKEELKKESIEEDAKSNEKAEREGHFNEVGLIDENE
jgi:thiol-disulfide isomerase/thioredoxin